MWQKSHGADPLGLSRAKLQNSKSGRSLVSHPGWLQRRIECNRSILCEWAPLYWAPFTYRRGIPYPSLSLSLFVWPLAWDKFAEGDPTRSQSSGQNIFQGHWCTHVLMLFSFFFVQMTNIIIFCECVFLWLIFNTWFLNIMKSPVNGKRVFTTIVITAMNEIWEIKLVSDSSRLKTAACMIVYDWMLSTLTFLLSGFTDTELSDISLGFL